MNKKQILKEYIQKEIPEIMELKFGCEVGYTLRGKSHWHLVVHKDGDYIWIVASLLGGKTWNGSTKKVHIDELNRIHGRPITLEDVLRVFGKIHDNIPFAETYQKVFRQDLESLLSVWRLGKPLNQQSEETIEFLHDLLDIELILLEEREESKECDIIQSKR